MSTLSTFMIGSEIPLCRGLYFGDERKLQRVKNVEVIGQKAFAKGLELIFDLPRETPLSLVGYPMR